MYTVGFTFGCPLLSPQSCVWSGVLVRAGMGRAGGKSAGGTPDWLGPTGLDGEGAPANRAEARAVQKEEKKRRPRRDKDDEDLDKPDKKGIRVRAGTA